jgi:hypothetical protein
MTHDDRHHENRGGGNRARWVLIAFLGVAAYFLIAEHKAHLSGYLQYWPYLLLLACPLLHLFMHGGHGHGGSSGHQHHEKGGKRE